MFFFLYSFIINTIEACYETLFLGNIWYEAYTNSFPYM